MTSKFKDINLKLCSKCQFSSEVECRPVLDPAVDLLCVDLVLPGAGQDHMSVEGVEESIPDLQCLTGGVMMEIAMPPLLASALAFLV